MIQISEKKIFLKLELWLKNINKSLNIKNNIQNEKILMKK